LRRQNFDNPASFGSESYSKEELVAEMTAAMLCGIAGIEQKTLENSAAYLNTWIARLKSDSRLLVAAASQAQKAADFIQGKATYQEAEAKAACGSQPHHHRCLQRCQWLIIRDACPNSMLPLNSNQVALRGQIMSYRNWHKYDFKVGNKIKHSGIATDLERREEEHRQRWPDGHIVQVGRATTEKAAKEWEETKQKAITPEP